MLVVVPEFFYDFFLLPYPVALFCYCILTSFISFTAEDDSILLMFCEVVVVGFGVWWMMSRVLAPSFYLLPPPDAL